MRKEIPSFKKFGPRAQLASSLALGLISSGIILLDSSNLTLA
jgi:hypothetical protein